MSKWKDIYIKLTNGEVLILQSSKWSRKDSKEGFACFSIDENNYEMVKQFLNDKNMKEIVFTVNPNFYNADLYLNKDCILYAEIQKEKDL